MKKFLFLILLISGVISAQPSATYLLKRDTTSLIPTKYFLSTNYYTRTLTDGLLNGKQATLVSGTNIKTINGNSLLGSGNLTVGTDSSVFATRYWANSTFATLGSLSSYLLKSDSTLYATQSDLTTGLSGKQASSSNLTSLAGLSYSSSAFVKMTGANTFTLDNSTYLTGNQTITLSGDVIGSGTTSISDSVKGIMGKSIPTLSTGLLKYNGLAWIFDTSTYLTGNQSISLGGILSGSGTTSITASAGSGYYMPTTTDQANWNTAYTNSHTHANKAKLDSLTNSASILNSLTSSVVSNSHTHANKAKLDSISVAASRLNSITGNFGSLAYKSSIGTSDVADTNMTFGKLQNIDSKFLVGRYSALRGSMQQIKVGSGLAISNDSLKVTSAAAVSWGGITGTLSNQTDLNNALGTKVDKSDSTDATSYTTKKQFNDGQLLDVKKADSTGVNGYATQDDLLGKQATLVSATNIKSINSNSLLGSGDISVATLLGLTPVANTVTVNGHALSSNVTVTKSDVSLSAVTNNAQVKKLSSSTANNVPRWANTSGDSLADGLAVGTSANNLVQLDANAKLPAVDGSQLTNLPSGTTIVVVVKSSNQAVTNSTTLVADSQLKFAVAANETWAFEFYINAADGSSGGIRALIDFPSGATCSNIMFGDATSGTAFKIYYGTGGGEGSGFGVWNNGGGGSFLQIKGTIVNGSTAGYCALKWAQSTATANGTTVMAGSSFLTAIKKQ